MTSHPWFWFISFFSVILRQSAYVVCGQRAFSLFFSFYWVLYEKVMNCIPFQESTLPFHYRCAYEFQQQLYKFRIRLNEDIIDGLNISDSLLRPRYAIILFISLSIPATFQGWWRFGFSDRYWKNLRQSNKRALWNILNSSIIHEGTFNQSLWILY